MSALWVENLSLEEEIAMTIGAALARERQEAIWKHVAERKRLLEQGALGMRTEISADLLDMADMSITAFMERVRDEYGLAARYCGLRNAIVITQGGGEEPG